ncbi:MAG TPA: M1 family metallopeptidase, partial [Acidimicrobiales bacterium]|nr:M1 family metallopeptidase [Acidimicrobiales bacterium]
MTGGITSGDHSLRYRLPYNVSPRRYRLHLAPDLETETFSGTVAIEAEAHEQLRSITLHSQELSITSAQVTCGGQTMRAQTRHDAEHDDRIVLELPRLVPAGTLQIEIAFNGKLLEQLSGFYLSSYTDAAGERRSLAVTQFEATDARRAFPCFDEPDRKAVFSLSVDVPPGLAACSNSPVASERPGAGGVTTLTFADTIPMSTYLVALVVGPLVKSDAVEVLGTPVRVVHVPGREHLARFALEVASHALRFFTEWFGLPYPAQKLDLVAVPDFAFGAMENLGCVVFREATLLVDTDRASRMDLVRVADVVSHEIAHMWFGDLVTMKWWNGIWLNEAFASFMEIAAVDAFRPEWERWVDFGVERDSAMATDALHSTRPIEYPVGPPEDAQGMFDVLTYQKGAGVLRMLESYLGPDTFRSGIRRYLVTHQLSNTETGDLWDAIEQESNEPVRRIMDSWILQGGFPLVTAVRHEAGLSLRREPFRYGAAPRHSAIGHGWPVPVLARRLGGEDTERLLLEDDPVTLDATTAPVVVNAGGWGFYRVAYDPASLGGLTARCAELEILERYNLLSDTWAAVVAGRAELADFLHLVEAMGRDPEVGVWRTITGALEFLDRAADDEARALVASYTRALLGPAFAALGWERTSGEGERTATLRA